jgi:hypothetical protein
MSSSFKGIPVKITNKLSVPLEIYDVFDPADSGQTAPYLYTKLGTIAADATDTVTTIREVSQLEAMYTGTISELQGWYYHQFPIKLMSGTQFSFGDPPPLSYTVEDSDRESMIQSFLFHKFAMANPDSALTKNLNAALKSSDSQAVNTFFAGTPNFKSCTLSSWNAVMTWLTMFTSGWQGPYYLYQAAPANPPQNYVPSLVGALNIVSTASANSATLTLCTQDSSGKLQQLSPAQTADVVMTGDGTMTDKNPGQDVSLSLTPVWANTIQTTTGSNGQPQTSYIAGPVLTGTAAGENVVSTQTLIPLPSQAQSGSSQSSSGLSSQTFSTICEVVGLLVGLVMIYELAEKRLNGKQSAEEKAKGDAKDEQDLEEQTEAVDNAPANGTAEVFTENAGTIASKAKGVSDGYTKTSNTLQEEVLTGTVNKEAINLNQQINNELTSGETPTQPFENAVTKITNDFSTAEQQIKSGNLPAASETVANAGSSIKTTLDQNASQMKASEVSTLAKSGTAVNEATDQTKALNDSQSNYNEDMNNPEKSSNAANTAETPETNSEPIEDL